jgi:hypothetical protein
MTNTGDKLSGGGGDVAPSPRSQASSGDRKKTQRTASVPIENCLIRGVQSTALGTTWEQNTAFSSPLYPTKQRKGNRIIGSYGRGGGDRAHVRNLGVIEQSSFNDERPTVSQEVPRKMSAGDFTTVENTMKQALCHLRANHPAATTAPKCSQVFLD